MAAAKTAQPDDLALLVGHDRKSFIIRLKPGSQLHTHRGVIPHDDLIGIPWGTRLSTHLGYPFLFLRPSTDDLVRKLKRTTQIIYPKDTGYILMKMRITPGCRVVEAGTGSGGLALVFAQAVSPTGRVYSYEVRPEMQRLARRNLERLGLSEFVEFKLRDIAEGFMRCSWICPPPGITWRRLTRLLLVVVSWAAFCPPPIKSVA